MKIFRTRDLNEVSTPNDVASLQTETDTIHATQAEAKNQLNSAALGFERKDFEVTQIELRTDKPGIVALLQGSPEFTIVKTWHGTARGGLKLRAKF